MKVFAGLIVATSATVDRIRTDKWWPANIDAPHCGCQVIIDPKLETADGYINKTCTIRFPYADDINYGRTAGEDPHFVSIASTYMVGRNRGENPDGFRFTGFDEVSNPDVLDILVFYENPDCARWENDFDKRDVSEIPSLPQDQWWEVYNVSEAQGMAMCSYELDCSVEDEQPSGVHLGNFNYDIARSVQTYTVPLYGLDKGNSATFEIVDYYNAENNCMNPLAHHGHGVAEGCSNTTAQTCANDITFTTDPDHNGLLEYFQFEPVQMDTAPGCAMPVHHEDDYQWNTPSPWDVQENFSPTEQGNNPEVSIR